MVFEFDLVEILGEFGYNLNKKENRIKEER